MVSLFYSYSHADSALRDELEKHLSLLRRQGAIATWHDRKIDAGQVIDHEISSHLKEAGIILLLVSPDFLSSDYCYDIEMTEAMRRHEAGEAVVIPVILRPCHWHRAPFGKLLAVPTDGKAVTQFTNRDEAFLDITRQIERVALKVTSTVKAPTGITGPALAAPIPTAPPLFRSANLGIAPKYTDYDQDTFIDEAFEFMASYFQQSLEELKRQHPQVDARFTRMDAQRFSATAYLAGQSKAQCMIFKGGLGGHGRAISFSHQISSDINGLNESLYLSIERDGLKLKPLGMAMLFKTPGLMDKQQAAEYCWSIFIKRIQ